MEQSRIGWLVLLWTCLSIGNVFAQAPVVYSDLEINASDGAVQDAFGWSVSNSGDLIIVGAPSCDVNGYNSGAAYVYRLVGTVWIEEAKLLASDGASEDAFGGSVSVSGNRVIVGAYGNSDFGVYTGSAYIFTFDGTNWIEEAKLLPSDGGSSYSFGYDVSISGDTAVVGAYRDAENGTDSGAAYVYQFTGIVWNLQTKLLASDGAIGDQFGTSVNISGNVISVGSPNANDVLMNVGAVYMFRFNGTIWIEEAKLHASDGSSYDKFGVSVAIDANVVVIGASEDDDNGNSSGSAYIFRYNGSSWNEEAKLLASDGGWNDEFGCSVSISGNSIVVGAKENMSYGTGAAYVYFYVGSVWNERAQLLASYLSGVDWFGTSVSIFGNTVIVGEPLGSGINYMSGSTYAFNSISDMDGDGVLDRLDNCYLYNPLQIDCNSNGIGDLCDIADGVSFDCDGNGIPDECQRDCNGNGIADVCDIASGTEQDCDGDGVPDSCSIAEVAKLLSSDGGSYDQFGSSISISGDVALIGAYYDSDNGSNAGSAYIFRYIQNAWVQEAKLLPSDGAAGDSFGWSVSVSGNTAVIGANGDDDVGIDSGSAYVFRFDGVTWSQEAKLLASDGASGDLFGHSVATSNDLVVIGAESKSHLGYHSGSAYVYRFNGISWVQETILHASDEHANQLFGNCVSMYGNTVAIGAPLSTGAVYMFLFDGISWIQTAKLVPSGGYAYEDFGTSISVVGDMMIVGATMAYNSFWQQAGAAYIFRFVGGVWVEEARVHASDGADYDQFGYSVSISGDRAIIGSPQDDDRGVDSGSAYLFQFDGSNWIEEVKLHASDGASDDLFGKSVCISGEMRYISSPGDNDNGLFSGSVYIIKQRPVFDCNGNGTLDVCDIADGTSSDINGDGVPDECQCIGDVDGDGFVNVNDILSLIGAWGATASTADLNGDGIVNITDLLLIVANWGPCTP